MTPYPPTECPRYDKCSVNLCPIDPDQELRTAHREDRQQECPMEKNVRKRIALCYPDLLPRLGLTTREHASAMVWASLPLAEKEARRRAAKERIKAWAARAQAKHQKHT